MLSILRLTQCVSCVQVLVTRKPLHENLLNICNSKHTNFSGVYKVFKLSDKHCTVLGRVLASMSDDRGITSSLLIIARLLSPQHISYPLMGLKAWYIRREQAMRAPQGMFCCYGYLCHMKSYVPMLKYAIRTRSCCVHVLQLVVDTS